MNGQPWDDWLPGVLSEGQIQELVERDYLRNANLDGIDYSAIDLHLSGEGYELVQGSIKPWGEGGFLHSIKNKDLIAPLTRRSDGTFELSSKKTYLFKLRENLYTDRVGRSPIHGQATAKSSVGRVDVLARLIVDGMDSYEEFAPKKAQKGNGELFLEITPMTFDVLVKEGIPLSQLRLFCGSPAEAEIRGRGVYRALLKESLTSDGSLSVDLSNENIGGLATAAFSARASGPSGSVPERSPIPLWTEDPRRPWDYWRFERANEHGRLRIRGGTFYILRSKERLALPADVAVYCRAIDETIGEIRIHYAGFAHTFFGRERDDGRIGTPLIFEVRGHDIDVSLRDGEKLARLVFYRMSKASKKRDKESDYSTQTLKLSKFFDKKWPEQLQDCGDGVVRPI
jgi:dCTP deaminase